MKLNFFWIPAIDSTSAAEELNRFLASHRVLQVEKQFSTGEGGHGAGWSVCVEWVAGQESAAPATSATGKLSKVDYKEVLDEETSAVRLGLLQPAVALDDAALLRGRWQWNGKSEMKPWLAPLAAGCMAESGSRLPQSTDFVGLVGWLDGHGRRIPEAISLFVYE